MPKYLCLQRSLPVAELRPTAVSRSSSFHELTPRSSGGSLSDFSLDSDRSSSTEMQSMYEKFGAWMATFQDNIVDMGGKLGEGRVVASDAPSDGPFVEVKELVGGYMIVSADDLEGAIEVARGCPGLVRPGSGVEVIEIHTQ
ncbi:MAG: hypothetical protein ACI8PZ_006074 [Myxococcota bacterium]|jgi:hypothetical protein